MSTAPALYPLRFKEILRNYSFGDRWIVRQYPAKQGLPVNHRVAETWEVCDRPGESSEVTNGALAGRTLHQLIDEYGARLLGERIAQRFGSRFPLLIKLLDATHVLGEQAHHSDDLAAARGMADPGKTEAWYMLQVKAGSTIRCGARPGVTSARLREALLKGTARECMAEQAVSPGDAFLLYAGTMHYSAGGQLFYEIMQNSDVFIGLGPFPSSMQPEEKGPKAEEALEGVHLEQAADYRARPVELPCDGGKRSVVLACEHFALERLEPAGAIDIAKADAFTVLTQIEGEAVVRAGGVSDRLEAGQSCLLPASLAPVTLEGTKGSATLRAWVPDLLQDIVRPMRKLGVPARSIAALGGHVKINPLGQFLDA